VVERNRISSLQSHGKALEKECCLSNVFCDSGDTPANLLCELNGNIMPCTSCFYGKWVEDVCAVIIIIIYTPGSKDPRGYKLKKLKSTSSSSKASWALSRESLSTARFISSQRANQV